MKQYDPKKVLFIFGAIIAEGYMDGTFISAALDEDAFTKKAGADGEVTRTRNRNSMGRVTLTLMQTSATNSLLSAAHLLDKTSGNGVAPLLIKDMMGSTLAKATNAWIAKDPDIVFAKDAEGREWNLDCESLELFSGGN